MSRRVYLLGVGLALVALGLAFTDWALSLRPGVTEANARRIRPGMTLAEVEGLLGEAWLGPGDEWGVWYGDDGFVTVYYSRDSRRVTRVWFDRHAESRSPIARLRAWLGW